MLLFLVAWLVFLSPAARAASDDYYSHPPGCLWNSLLLTNGSAAALVAYSGDVIVAANTFVLDGSDLYSWGLLAKLNGDSGTVLLTTNFHGAAINTKINALIPVTSAGGSVEALAFAGSKDYWSAPWGGSWVWLVKTDLNLVAQTEAHIGTVSHLGSALALIQEPSGFAVGGYDGELFSGSYGTLNSWFGRFDGSLNLTAQTNLSCEQVSGVTLAGGGGYVLTTSTSAAADTNCQGVMKITSSFSLNWRTSGMPPGSDCHDSYYYRIKALPDGYVALGRRYCSGNPAVLLAKFAIDGSVLWSRGNTNGVGADLILTPDGGFLVVGSSSTRRLDDIPCAWLMRADAEGQTLWEMCLGGEHGAGGIAGAVALDGNYLVAGNATLADDTNRVWVVKVNASQQAPIAAFTVTPASPVFRNTEVTFDATASSAPGSAIASYEWEFGDGTTATGAIVRHTYNAPATNIVTLTIVNTNSVYISTSQQVVVVGLAIQWERFYGDGHGAANNNDVGYALVESADGGFVVAGKQQRDSRTDVWAFKTDARGRQLWSTSIADTNLSGSAVAYSVVRAHDAGYVLAASSYSYHDSYWYHEPWLVKLDESGELAWPVRVYGALLRDERAYGVARTGDGGYMLTGYNRSGISDGRCPWLLKTDENGMELWNRNLTNNGYSGGRAVIETTDGGYLLTGATGWDPLAPPLQTYKTDSTGVPLWTNTFGGSGSFEGGGRWLAERPGGGSVVVGGYRALVLLFLNSDGTVADSRTWRPANGDDYAHGAECATVTPDGGYILGGYMTFRNSVYWQQREIALIKTDSAGNTNWLEMLPGTTNRNETAYGVVALTNNAYVVLGYREVNSRTDPTPQTVWLFKLAPNHPPVPRVSFSPSPVAPGQTITFDGSASSDPDGTIVAWEWDFGDGVTTNGSVVQHAYSAGGSFPIRLTVIDNNDAERTLTNWTCAVGISALSTGITLTRAEVTNAPNLDPVNYPTTGAPADLDWDSAFGFRLGATGPNGSKAFRIAFCEPITTNYHLYRLPAWTTLAYTNVNQVAIDLSLPIAGGALNTNLVLARAFPSCRIIHCEQANADRLALTFTTESGYTYRVCRSPQLVPADWQPITMARSLTDPLTLDTLDGTGADETVYVSKLAETSVFLRIKLE